MKQTAIPSVFPAEGTFEFSALHIDLSCVTPGAVIRYTTDGSVPAAESPVYQRADGLLSIKCTPGRDVFTVRAVTQAPGLAPSPVTDFVYRFQCRDKGTYRHEMLREPAPGCAGLIRIEDFDLDKMYLLIGTERAVLIDAGWDESGDLPGLCAALTGGLPVDLVVAHGHPDHVAQANRFLQAGRTVYLPHRDQQTVEVFGYRLPFDRIRDIRDGDLLELGGAALRAYHIPGHTPGGVVLLDEQTGDLFASDAFGSNRRYVPDSAWLQLADYSAETCLHTLDAFLSATQGRLKRIFTGHNDEILDANAYLAALQRALRQAVDGGPAALRPSLRSAAESFGSGVIAVDGDWRIDPIWAAANLKFLYEADAAADPPQYAPGFIPGIQTAL